MKPYLYSYDLPPGMSYADAGRLKLERSVNPCQDVVEALVESVLFA